jgi:hypothetical protein
LCRYDSLARLGIQNAKKHLKKKFTGGVMLETCFVGDFFIDNVNSSVAEALVGGAWPVYLCACLLAC